MMGKGKLKFPSLFSGTKLAESKYLKWLSVPLAYFPAIFSDTYFFSDIQIFFLSVSKNSCLFHHVVPSRSAVTSPNAPYFKVDDLPFTSTWCQQGKKHANSQRNKWKAMPKPFKILLSCPEIWGFFPQNGSSSIQFSLVQSISRVRLFATPWIAARQASLSITNSWSSLRLTSIESVMPSSHLILCRPLLLLHPIPPSIRVFSNESTLRMRWPKY